MIVSIQNRWDIDRDCPRQVQPVRGCDRRIELIANRIDCSIRSRLWQGVSEEAKKKGQVLKFKSGQCRAQKVIQEPGVFVCLMEVRQGKVAPEGDHQPLMVAPG